MYVSMCKHEVLDFFNNHQQTDVIYTNIKKTFVITILNYQSIDGYLIYRFTKQLGFSFHFFYRVFYKKLKIKNIFLNKSITP